MSLNCVFRPFSPHYFDECQDYPDATKEVRRRLTKARQASICLAEIVLSRWLPRRLLVFLHPNLDEGVKARVRKSTFIVKFANGKIASQ
jgi:hypothetical protein